MPHSSKHILPHFSVSFYNKTSQKSCLYHCLHFALLLLNPPWWSFHSYLSTQTALVKISNDPHIFNTHTHTHTHTEVVQSCPTLCDPMDCSPPGSLVHGIFQAWILEWVAVSFSQWQILSLYKRWPLTNAPHSWNICFLQPFVLFCFATPCS